MFARIFIDRPIGAWVLSIVILLAGGVSLYILPVAQYPEITPPSVQVNCQYPGASAVVVSDTVAAPIEQQVNGVEQMMYMSSQCTNDGTYNLTVTFRLGTDLNMAQVLVQNRVNQALPTLPDVVKATGVTVKKKSPSILLVVNMVSEDDPATKQPYYDQLFLSNFATIQIKDELARINGVGDVTFLGQQDYSMRIWVDPEKLASRNLTADDVVRVLKEQNVQVAAGQIGQPPVPTGQAFQYTMTTMGRLKDPEQFAAIVLKVGANAEVTRVSDVARVELGAKNQDTINTLDGKPTVGMAVFQLPGSNALAVADVIKEKMKELKLKRFPEHLDYRIVYDTTPFIEESVAEVGHTLRDAIILVAIVVLCFLQDWKSVMLPLIDVAVSLVGTLAVMKMIGFTLNNLTLFGLVLAIGIVVDDAIVVLENIERWVAMGHKVREATLGAMAEITGPIIGITLVLCSVFLPSSFLPGINGQFYRQFALTIAASMVLSAINAMTMTPARAASIFKDPQPGHEHGHDREALPWWGVAGICGFVPAWLAGSWLAGLLHIQQLENFAIRDHKINVVLWSVSIVLFVAGAFVGWLVSKPVNSFLGAFFKLFNRVFDALTAGYAAIIRRLLRVCFIVLAVYGGLLVLTWYGFTHVPVGFIPPQDKGYLVVSIQLPDSASLERTYKVTERVGQIARETKGVAHTVNISGMAIILNSAVSSNFASIYVVLDSFHHRHLPELYSDEIAKVIRQRCYEEIQEARVGVFGAPPVDGLGSAGGFKLMVKDIGSRGFQELQGQADNLAEQGNSQPGLVGIFNSFRADTPQLYVDIDRVKCKTLGVSLDAVFDTLQVYMGGYYVNDFNFSDRTWQVKIQADSAFRLSPASVEQLKVRNANGEMLPLGTVVHVRDSSGPVMVTRYQMFPAATINGASLPGVSTGTVVQTMDALSKDVLSTYMAAEWTELMLLQTESGNSAIYAFAGAVVLVFLVLAFLYESWSDPFAVILVVPMCLLCAVAGVAIARLDINIFVQVGFVVLVGLAAKNAILVVEFARDLRKKTGQSVLEATVEASRVRLRPIIMTSLAFILGVVPLVLASGAGAEMRKSLGTAVCAGMIGVTAFGIFLTPVFYYVLNRFTDAALPAIKKPE